MRMQHAFLGGLAPVDGTGSAAATMDTIFGAGKWKPNKSKLALVKFSGGRDPDSQQIFIQSIPTPAAVAALAGVGLVGVIGFMLGRR